MSQNTLLSLLSLFTLISFTAACQSSTQTLDPPSGSNKAKPCDNDDACLKINQDFKCLPDDQGNKVCRKPESGELVKSPHECKTNRDCTKPNHECLTDRNDGTRRCVKAVVKEKPKDECQPATVEADCGPRHLCVQTSTRGRVCVANRDKDGEPCEQDTDCAGGTCLKGDDWPGGYCTTQGCKSSVNCSSERDKANACRLLPDGSSSCLRTCTSAADCREGYTCEDFIPNQPSICIKVEKPEPPVVNPTNPYDADTVCEPITGRGPFPLTVEIPVGTIGWQLSAWLTVDRLDKRRSYINPTYISRIDLPNGNSVDMRDAFPPSPLYVYFYPTLRKYLPLYSVPARANELEFSEPGTYKFHLQQHDEYKQYLDTNLCHRVISKTELGNRIDLDFYFVDIPQTNANGAPFNPLIQEMIQTVKEIYSKSGIEIGKVRYHDVSKEVADRYKIVDERGDYYNLLANTEFYGVTKDDARSVSIFIVQNIIKNGKPTPTLGFSPGLPREAADYGGPFSGVIFKSESLDQTFTDIKGNPLSGPYYTGKTLAHEIGHYLGLYHTREIKLSEGEDPLADTPVCPEGIMKLNMHSCPDGTNVMFPINLLLRDHSFSAEQGHVLKSSAFTYKE